MNVRLRAELLSKFWLLCENNQHQNITAQQLYGVSNTASISEDHLQALEEFFEGMTPWFAPEWDEDTNVVSYLFPGSAECLKHIIYNVLINNKDTFVKFLVTTYLVEDADAVLGSEEAWTFIVKWALKYDLTIEYLPVKRNTIISELENIGYTRCTFDGRPAVWGLRIG